MGPVSTEGFSGSEPSPLQPTAGKKQKEQSTVKTAAESSESSRDPRTRRPMEAPASPGATRRRQPQGAQPRLSSVLERCKKWEGVTLGPDLPKATGEEGKERSQKRERRSLNGEFRKGGEGRGERKAGPR